MDKLDFYRDILSGIYLDTEEKTNEYLEFCLNYVKDNIIYCYDNKNSIQEIIKELFKRGMAKKWSIDNQKIIMG